MSNWEKVRLGDVCAYENRRIDISVLTQDTYISTENMQLNKGGVTVSSALPVNGGAVKFAEGQTLVSNIRPYFKKIWFADKDGGCSNDVLCFRLNKDIDNKYFYYLLSQDSFFDYVMSGSKGTKMPRGDRGQIMQFEFLLPSLEEQGRIAGILGALDDKIECNNRINRNLEEQAAALFRRWFVDFEFPNPDPTSPTYGKPYRSAGGTMQDSPLGPIPQGWQVGKFTDIVDILGGGTPNTGTNDFWNGDIPFFTPKDAKDNLFTLSTEKYITNKGLDKCSSKLYPSETVFITARGTVGKVAIAGCDMAMNQSCYALVGKNGIGQYFVYHITKETVSLLRNKASGAVFDAITTRDFESEHIVIPSKKLSNEFDETVKSFMKLILSNTIENQTIATLRDTLLPKLMNNQIKL